MLRIMSLLFVAAVAASGSTIDADLSAELHRTMEVGSTSRGSVPVISGGYAGFLEGMPMLPSIPVTVALPRSEEAASVRSTALWETAAGSCYIPPLPAPAPLSIPRTADITAEAAEVYAAAGYWPSEPVELSGTGFLDGVPEAQLLVHPYRWDPATGELQRMTSLSVSITTTETSARPVPETDLGFQRMLIVTQQSLCGPFQELAQRRTDQGIYTQVVTMDSIYSVSSGRDNAERLRNFVKDYYTSYGLDYLLLGGDTGMVPFRKAYAMTCEAGMHTREDSLPCDLYFADLDGTWDANGNNVFGEVADDVDLFPDIFVGRAPVDNVTEAQTFVNNIAAYEDCLHDDFYQRVLFLAMILWSNPYTNSGESKDMIDEEFLPDFLEITKLYEALGNENLASTMAALNEGQNFINHDGHAWYSSIGVGTDYMGISDVDAIDAGGRFASTMYSIGCWSAAYDFDAIGEHFLFNQDGGSIGYIGNSSYGWGSPGNPCYGYSDALDHLFHDLLYSDWSLTTGQLLAHTKEYFIPYSQWENVYRWHQYDVNLLGDPAVRPYRNTPSEITLDCPDMVSSGTLHFPVQISGVPAEGLTVCLRDQADIWLVTELDATGYFSFFLPCPPTGSLKITVTGPGVRRTSVIIPVSTGPQPVIADIDIDDTGGDGMLSPGDQADLTVTLMNQGTQNMTNVSLEAELESGPGSITQPSITYGALGQGASSAGSGPLEMQINSTATNGNVMDMALTISSDQGTWDLELSLMVCAPGLYFATYSIDDSAGGNDNGIPEPGETVDLTASIANFGLLNASDVTVVMAECPADITWLSDSATVDSIAPDCTGSFTFTCQLDGGMASPSFPWLFMDISSPTTGYSSPDSLRLTVGETGISNDVESGESGWTHDGTGDLWNISTIQSHSPAHSWHCGDSEGYDPNMDCALYSPELILAPGAELSFWATFDVAIYGTDGMYVIVNEMNDGDKDTLDYIGSGGALGGGYRGIGTGWATWSYDLSEWGTGNYVQLEFRFISDSDSDTGMGFYLDDISVEGAYTGTVGIETPQPFAPVMGLPSPNPAASAFSVPLCITEAGIWNLSLYDLSGRLVASQRGESPVSAVLEMDVSGLSSGVYFLRLSGTADATGRLVVLR